MPDNAAGVALPSIKMPGITRKKPAVVETQNQDSGTRLIVTGALPELVKKPYTHKKEAQRRVRALPDYKDPYALRHYLTEISRIRPRRNNNPREQRKIAQAIKRARFLALIPYVS